MKEGALESLMGYIRCVSATKRGRILMPGGKEGGSKWGVAVDR